MIKRSFVTFLFLLAFTIFATSCGGALEDPVIIWTNKSEIVSYVELFNLTTKGSRAVVVFKENPADAFPPMRDEDTPDIIIGPWLKNAETRSNFVPLDYFFDDQLISRTQFYPQLLQYGNIGGQHYLLPVSFNLSAMVLSQKNSSAISENYILSPDQIMNTSADFNVTEGGVYSSMGFAPSWTPEFLYEVATLNNVNFLEQRRSLGSFTWNETNLNATIDYFKEWTSTNNTSTIAETEYQFKYLFNPTLKNIADNNSLFAFITSDELFVSSSERLDEIYFRWIEKDGKISVQDDMITMGLYKHSKNLSSAEHFISWFMNEESQETLLNWSNSLNFNTNTFGVTGGFSSIRSVNERVFPVLYPVLWGNLPPQELLTPPNRLPSNWDSIKQVILLPYLLDAINTEASEPIQTIQERLSDWYRFSQ